LKASGTFLSLYRMHDSNAILSNKKNKNSEEIHKKNLRKINEILSISEILLQRGILPPEKKELLETLISLLRNNKKKFFNFKLHAFLIKNKEDFLPLHKNPKKYAFKLCRGQKLFRILSYIKKPSK
jgi:hypothetical protein